MRRSTMFAIYGTLSLGAVDIAFSLTRFLIVQLTQVGDSRSITTIGMRQFESSSLSFALSQHVTHLRRIILESY